MPGSAIRYRRWDGLDELGRRARGGSAAPGCCLKVPGVSSSRLAHWAEGRSEVLEEVEASAPRAFWGGPVQSVGVMGVDQDVPVQHMGEMAVGVGGELPVCGLLGLG